MSELDIIKTTKTPLTKDDLKAFFKKIGIQSNDTLVVHTALSKLGFVIGGAQSVLEALLETLSEGTLIMPAHSGDLSNPEEFENPPVPDAWIPIMKEKMPAFNPQTTPLRGMGKVATQFMAMKDTLRSNHPVASFCAQGVHAKQITNNQPLSPMFGLDSPLGNVYRLGGKVLMLGAPLSTCSAFHVSEALSGVIGKTQEESPVLINNKREWKVYEDYDYDEEDFAQIGEKLLTMKIIKAYKIPNGKAHIMDIHDAIDGAAEIIKATRKK